MRRSLSRALTPWGWGPAGASCSVCDVGTTAGVQGALGPRHLTATSPCSDWCPGGGLGTLERLGFLLPSSSDAGKCPLLCHSRKARRKSDRAFLL